MRRIELGAQDRTIAGPLVQRAFECLYRGAGPLHAKRGVATGQFPAAGVEQVFAEHDILTRDIGLIRAAAIVTADDTAIGCRPLRPVDPATFKYQLFRRMVSSGQSGNETRDWPRHRVDDDDARAVVESRSAQRLIGIRREKPPAPEPIFEPNVDGGP